MRLAASFDEETDKIYSQQAAPFLLQKFPDNPEASMPPEISYNSSQ
jgi:hypothetical protein